MALPSRPTERLTPKASRMTIMAKTKLMAKALVMPSSSKMMVASEMTNAECEEGIPPVTMRSCQVNDLWRNQ